MLYCKSAKDVAFNGGTYTAYHAVHTVHSVSKVPGAVPGLAGKVKPYAGEVMSPFEPAVVAATAVVQTAVIPPPAAAPVVAVVKTAGDVLQELAGSGAAATFDAAAATL